MYAYIHTYKCIHTCIYTYVCVIYLKLLLFIVANTYDIYYLNRNFSVHNSIVDVEVLFT